MTNKIPLSDKTVETLSNLIGEPRPAKPEASLQPWLNAARWVALAAGIEATLPLVHSCTLSQMAEAWNCRLRHVTLTEKWWLTDSGPLLVFNDKGQAYALLPSTGGSYVVKESSQGDEFELEASFASSIQPTAYAFYRPYNDSAVTWRDILSGALTQSKYICWLLLLTQAAIGLTGLLIPIAMGALFNDIIPNAESGLLFQWSLVLFVGVVLTGFLSYQQAILLMRLRFKNNVLLQSALWDRLLRLPLSVINRFNIGDLAMRGSAFDTIQQSLTVAVIQGILNIIFAIFPLGAMFYYSWQLALITLCGLAFTIACYIMAFYVLLNYQKELLEQRGKLSSWIVQLLQNISKIRTSAAEERVYLAWMNQFIDSVSTLFRINQWNVRLSVLNSGMTVGVTMLIFAVAAWGGMKISFANFISFFSAYGLFSAAIFATSQLIVSVTPLLPWLGRIQPLLETPPENAYLGEAVTALSGSIMLKGVSFGYPNRPLLLDNVSLTIKPGECVGIIGASGAGKSTLLRLLLGFLSPTQGQILYDQHDIAKINLPALRRQLGVVLQQDTLIAGTIFDNLSDGIDIGEAKALGALDLVGIKEQIMSLPMGLYTSLMDKGLTLSSGERQRLLIARALIYQPRILLFDEASSALDNLIQDKIFQKLKLSNQTIILVAQRTSSLIYADKILHLSQGKLVNAPISI